ncbi:hypothetical protein A2U01_0038867, partial [Trifolium medium]|nr:hypothetical protein [Trifolium medium]
MCGRRNVLPRTHGRRQCSRLKTSINLRKVDGERSPAVVDDLYSGSGSRGDLQKALRCQ